MEKPPELYWPLPPLQPRIKFVDLILGSIDVTGVRIGKFSQLLFGEGKETLFLKPTFVAERNNVIYVTDVNSIKIFDYNRKKFFMFGTRFLFSATGIHVSTDGTMYVGDSGRRVVFAILPNLEMKIFGRPQMFESVGGVTVDEGKGLLYAVDSKGHKINMFDMEGELVRTFGKRGLGPGEFNYPYDITLDKEGNIYIVDAGNFRVQIFDRDWNFVRTFGAVGMEAGYFSRPKGISVDTEGHIYVVDAGFGNFQIFDKNGTVLLSVGSNGADPGKFSLPAGIFINDKDKIYIVDQMNKRVQIFQYLGEGQSPPGLENPRTPDNDDTKTIKGD